MKPNSSFEFEASGLRSRGAVMSEFVLVMPLIVTIIALLWYMGGLMTRAQHMTEMPRYEVWRAAERGTGPAADDTNGHRLLNEAFFGDAATSIGHPISDGAFPEEPYTTFVTDSGQSSNDANTWASAFIYRPGGGTDSHRLDNGWRQAFTVYHAAASKEWSLATALSTKPVDNPEENTPLWRQHVRIGNAWAYTNDWKASGTDPAQPYDFPMSGVDQGEIGVGHLRASRDAFFLNYDASLDAIDGSGTPEYSDNAGGPENPDSDTLAGFIRTMWLQAAAYRGPTVILQDTGFDK